jgi:hypothetical protein
MWKTKAGAGDGVAQPGAYTEIKDEAMQAVPGQFKGEFPQEVVVGLRGKNSSKIWCAATQQISGQLRWSTGCGAVVPPLRREHGFFTVQQSLIREYTRTFVGRTYALDALEQFVRTHDRGYFLVRGSPGQGKTALSCSFITRWESVHHLVNRSGGRADLRLAMRSLIAQIPGGRGAVESLDGLAKLLSHCRER